MQLVLWRHADAEDASGGRDADRALTARGHEQAKRGAEWLRARLAGGDWRILASPALRARQTLEALGVAFEEAEGVGLAATPGSVLRAAGWPDGAPVVVVGHQPTLGEVAERLLGRAIEVRKGAILWLETGAAASTLVGQFEPE